MGYFFVCSREWRFYLHNGEKFFWLMMKKHSNFNHLTAIGLQLHLGCNRSGRFPCPNGPLCWWRRCNHKSCEGGCSSGIHDIDDLLVGGVRVRLQQPFLVDRMVRSDRGQNRDQFLGNCGDRGWVIVQVHLNLCGRDADGGDQDLVVVGVQSETGKRTVDGGQRRRAHQQHGNQQSRQAHHRSQIDGWNR